MTKTGYLAADWIFGTDREEQYRISGPVSVDYGYLLDPPSFRSATGVVLRQPQGAIHIRFGQSFYIEWLCGRTYAKGCE